jgi:hypothetical protein
VGETGHRIGGLVAVERVGDCKTRGGAPADLSPRIANALPITDLIEADEISESDRT